MKFDAARTKLLALEQRIKDLKARVEDELAGKVDPSADLGSTAGIDELKRDHQVRGLCRVGC